MTEVVTRDSKVSLFFELSLENGQVVDGNFDKEPATFTFGDENLLPEFENCLLGLKTGDEKSFVMPPEKAFGAHNPENIQHFPRHQFNLDSPIEPGIMISFADANGAELPGMISAVNGDDVEVDFNHPLAGKTLNFRALITAIEAV